MNKLQNYTKYISFVFLSFYTHTHTHGHRHRHMHTYIKQ